jgi:hypothetical protein
MGLAGVYWLNKPIGVGIAAQRHVQADFWSLSASAITVGPTFNLRFPTWGGYWTASAGAAYARLHEDYSPWLCKPPCRQSYTMRGNGLNGSLQLGYLQTSRINVGAFIAVDWDAPLSSYPIDQRTIFTLNFVFGSGF